MTQQQQQQYREVAGRQWQHLAQHHRCQAVVWERGCTSQRCQQQVWSVVAPSSISLRVLGPRGLGWSVVLTIRRGGQPQHKVSQPSTLSFGLEFELLRPSLDALVAMRIELYEDSIIG